MSHFTNIKTRFQNLAYLEKALKKLNINNIRENDQNQEKNIKLVISQTNGHDIQFSWNGHEYELIFDASFWEQSCPVENFIDKIAQEYAGETIVNEGNKEGFKPTKYKLNLDGSKTLTLQRWGK